MPISNQYTHTQQSEVVTHIALPVVTAGSSLAALHQPQVNKARGRGRAGSQPRRPLCKTCYEAEKGRSTYVLHNIVDLRCPSRIQYSAINEYYPDEVVEYRDDAMPGHEDLQVNNNQPQLSCLRCNCSGKLNHIQPVPAQILSLSDSAGSHIALELDSDCNMFLYNAQRG